MTFNLLNSLSTFTEILPVEGIENASELFNIQRILGFILIGFINSLLMIAIAPKFFRAMQQCGYKGAGYYKWLNKRDNVYLTRIVMLSMLSVLGFLLVNMAVSFINHPLIKYSGFLVYFIFLAVYFRNERKNKPKVPLVLTKRIWRMIISFVLLTTLTSVLLILIVNLIAMPFSSNLLANFRYAILCLCPILVPYLVHLAFRVNEPIEKLINKRYFDACKKTLQSRTDLIKIAITGSYAKTSVKNILEKFLSEKYNVLSSPESYNTPMGIVKTVKRLNDAHQVLICEMGARRIGDIKELSSMVNQDISIITGITHQHLETFLTIDNIIKTKSEIIKDGFNGKAFISSDNKHTLSIYSSAKCEKYLAGVKKYKNSFIYAEDIVVSENGTDFNIVYDGEKYKAHTVLLGEHNVSNIMLASSVALKLGLTIYDIISAISKLEMIPHRLELIKTSQGVNVIDDGYNANPDGVKQAIGVLKYFGGKKYVVTPGIVELGIEGYKFNHEVGALLASVCDGVILVGRGGSLHIREGLLSKEYPTDKIFMVKDLNQAKEKIKEIVKEGDVVLFSNDLPDILE
ncbi:MAG: UDP-N-acetylmuramoyl-tripeptide--D-alanyl-D-alanine ligase [Clostridiales bacterium]|nr:UDP-N-acetylmuramoyl-tripeptide--D-alanyl-D-alanine ligase [Clostridiales bacterium]